MGGKLSELVTALDEALWVSDPQALHSAPRERLVPSFGDHATAVPDGSGEMTVRFQGTINLTALARAALKTMNLEAVEEQ